MYRDSIKEAIEKVLEEQGGLEQQINDMLDSHWGDNDEERLKVYLYLMHLELRKIRAASTDSGDPFNFLASLQAVIHTLVSESLPDSEEIQVEVITGVLSSILSKPGVFRKILEDIIDDEEDNEEDDDLSRWFL